MGFSIDLALHDTQNVTMPTGRLFKYLAAVAILSSCAVLALAQTVPGSQWIAFSRAGAPNSNLQCFTPGNVAVSDGYLRITTKVETASCASFDLPQGPQHFTSGFISMRRFNFLYGTVEFRVKFGGGTKTGAWPIVWMQDASCQASDPMGTDDRCNGQEIDIAEILNGDFTHVNQQIHVNDMKQNDGCTASVRDVSQNFHTYQLVWSPGSLVFKIDGSTTCTIKGKSVPNAPMYVKINNFVGCAGGAVNNASLPWTTLVDYIKVTQGSAIVFNDDFNTGSSIEPAQPTPPSCYHPAQSSGTPSVSRWRLGLAVLCALVIAVITFVKVILPIH
jgi:beta-glucanase (GH16 family)